MSQHPLPKWYKDSNYGIIIHWGLYSVPAYHDFEHTHRKSDFNGSEWYWKRLKAPSTSSFGYGPTTKEYHEKTYPGEYQDFAEMFTADRFDPDQWAQQLKETGAEYIILTAKHHDGFCLWDAPNSLVWRGTGKKKRMESGWNSVQRGPHRDLVGELAQAVRKVGLRFGVYYSLYEWFNQLYIDDKKNNTDIYVEQVVKPQIGDLILKYRPDVLWLDGDWDRTPEYWKIGEIMTWVYTVQPEIVINDRLGSGTHGKYGDVFNYEDRWGPGRPGFTPAKALAHPWEMVETVSRSWAVNNYQRPEHWKTADYIFNLLIEVAKYQGHLLMGIGPRADGTLVENDMAPLLQVGEWLRLLRSMINSTYTQIRKLLESQQVSSFRIDPRFLPVIRPGRSVIVITDTSGQDLAAEIKYDQLNNQIYDPDQ